MSKSTSEGKWLLHWQMATGVFPLSSFLRASLKQVGGTTVGLGPRTKETRNLNPHTRPFPIGNYNHDDSIC
jgi:hypothetical protein